MTSFGDLMAGPPPTHLPADPADAELAGGDAPAAVVRALGRRQRRKVGGSPR